MAGILAAKSAITSWTLGPYITVRYGVASWFSIGFQSSLSYVFPSDVNVVGIGAGSTNSGGFLMGSIGVNAAFHVF